MKWIDAIALVLGASNEPLDSAEIAAEAIGRGLAATGAMQPEWTVQAAISRHIKSGNEKGIVAIATRGAKLRYWLLSKQPPGP